MFNAENKNKNYGWVLIRPSGKATVVLLRTCLSNCICAIDCLCCWPEWKGPSLHNVWEWSLDNC